MFDKCWETKFYLGALCCKWCVWCKTLMYVMGIPSSNLNLNLMFIVQENSLNNTSNSEIHANGTSLDMSENDQNIRKNCTAVLSIDSMSKLSVSSQTETAILNQQKSLRDTLSKSSGTAV